MVSLQSARASLALAESAARLRAWADDPSDAALELAVRACREVPLAVTACGELLWCAFRRGATHTSEVGRMLGVLAPHLSARDRFAICARLHTMGCPWELASKLALHVRQLTPRSARPASATPAEATGVDGAEGPEAEGAGAEAGAATMRA
jgi:hypothetical protein